MEFVPLSCTQTSEQSREPLKERVWKYNIICENTRKRNLHGKNERGVSNCDFTLSPGAIFLFFDIDCNIFQDISRPSLISL